MSLEDMKQEDRDLLSGLVMGMHEYGQRLSKELADTGMENLNARHYYEKAIALLALPIPTYRDLSDDEREDVQGWGSRGVLLAIARRTPRSDEWDEDY
jgi:hypothetical protein